MVVDELEVVLRLEVGEPFRLVAKGEEASVGGGFGHGEGGKSAADTKALDFSINIFLQVGGRKEDMEEHVRWGACVCCDIATGACGFVRASFGVVGVHVT